MKSKPRPLNRPFAVQPQPWCGRRRTKKRVETEGPGRDQLHAVMGRIGEFLDAQGKAFTRTMLAEEIGSDTGNVSEWIRCTRAVPSGPRLTQILLAMIRHDREFVPFLKALAMASKNGK